MVELADAMPQLGVYPVLPATTLNTSGTPSTYDGTPAVISITTGGTAGNELIDLLNPDLPIDAWFNPYLIGQRVVFCLATQTNASDVVVITAGGSGSIDFYPNNNADGIKGVSSGAKLDYVGASVCFVWCGEQWCIDFALTTSEFSGPYTASNAQLTAEGSTAFVRAAVIQAETEPGATTDAHGGDFTLLLGAGNGTGRQGTFSGGLPAAADVSGEPLKWYVDASGFVKIVPEA